MEDHPNIHQTTWSGRQTGRMDGLHAVPRSEVDSTVEITNTDSILHCFTDGSSRYPQDPDLRRGAWAAAYWDTNTLNFVVLGTERMVGRMQVSNLAELMQRSGRADGHTQIHVALKAGQTMRAWSTWWPTFHIGLQIINSHTAISSGTYMEGTLKAVHKVHSHQTNHDTPGHTWAQQGNALVDLQAGATAWTWWPGEEELWYPLRWQKTENRIQLTTCQEHMVEVANFYRALQKQSSQSTMQETSVQQQTKEAVQTTGTPGSWNYQTRKRQRIHEVPQQLRLDAAAADDWAKQVGFGPASRFWAFMVIQWSPTTPQRWVSWAQLAILYLAITGDYPTHEGQTKRRRTMVAPAVRGEGKLWSDMISTVRGIAVAAGKAFPWLMTSMCQRPTDTLRIVTTCTAWRIDPALIEQCDSVITNILPTTAVSSTAFRTPITREHTHTKL